MSTYLGIPRPSAFILYFKRVGSSGNSSGNRGKLGIPRIRRFRIFFGCDLWPLPRDCIENIDEMASDSEKNVAMVLIKLLPNTF